MKSLEYPPQEDSGKQSKLEMLRAMAEEELNLKGDELENFLDSKKDEFKLEVAKLVREKKSLEEETSRVTEGAHVDTKRNSGILNQLEEYKEFLKEDFPPDAEEVINSMRN